MGRRRVVYIEPFEGGSHARFTRALTTRVRAEWTTLTLPGRHWKWRARGSGVWFARAAAAAFDPLPDALFASSYLPLPDLMALVPGLASIPRVLYFHENQLSYPVRPGQARERDNHFGFSQLVSALAATHCVFNSAWNQRSFLEAGAHLLSRLPDAVPPGWIDDIAARSRVLPVPMRAPEVPPEALEPTPRGPARVAGPIILWNHRWEFDKAPEAFFEVLFTLADEGVPFRLAVCGERYRKAPPIFAEAERRLASRVVHWGFLPDRAAYEALLGRCHLAVSTADHEFFGISMLEATAFGARPLVPDRLSYPEIFPDADRYREGELVDRLRTSCHDWVAGRVDLRGDRRPLLRPYDAPLIARYQAFIDGL